MKYREIYKALERRWKVSPGFRFSDISGWRNPRANRPVLWIVVEDRLSGLRVWLTQIGRDLSITYKKMDKQGVCYGESVRIGCTNQEHMAQELDALFTRTVKAA